MENGSSWFYLSTFEASYTVQMIIFGFLLSLYVVTVLANLLVVVAVLMCVELQKPMYIFLANMAAADIIGCSCCVPKQLLVLLTGDSTILYEACFVQMFCVHMFGNVEVLTLSAMAFDRYVAICHPLRYHAIVTNRKTLVVILLTWVVTTVAYASLTILAAGLKFRDTNPKIQGIFCDNMGLVTLAASDNNTKINSLYSIVLMVILFMLPLISISHSYLKVFIACRIKRSTEVTRNGLNTLFTHFLALSIFFLVVYMTVFMPRFVKDISNPTIRNIRCFFQLGILAVPISNAIIYFFRTKELRKGIMMLCKRTFIHRALFPKIFNRKLTPVF